MATLQIFTAQGADGNSSEFIINGRGIFKATGTFGGGTIALQIKLAHAADTTFANTDDVFTADFAKEITAVKGVVYRLNLSGSTAPTINAFVENNS